MASPTREDPAGLKLILGHVRNVDYGDPEARRQRLRRRCAVLWPAPDPDDPRFDADLAVRVARSLADAAGATRARVALDGPEAEAPRVLPSLDALEAHYQGLPPTLRAPFRRIELGAEAGLAGLIQVARAGGPTAARPTRAEPASSATRISSTRRSSKRPSNAMPRRPGSCRKRPCAPTRGRRCRF